MKNSIRFWINIIILLALPGSALSRPPLQVDILYMNHGPMQPVLKDLRALFSHYGDTLKVAWHDFESDAGERFKAKKKIRNHTPLVIWIDGRIEQMQNGRKIEFKGFPSGSGPSFFQGTWQMQDLKIVLERATGK